MAWLTQKGILEEKEVLSVPRLDPTATLIHVSVQGTKLLRLLAALGMLLHHSRRA